jgi:hypothetical protein
MSKSQRPLPPIIFAFISPNSSLGFIVLVTRTGKYSLLGAFIGLISSPGFSPVQVYEPIPEEFPPAWSVRRYSSVGYSQKGAQVCEHPALQRNGLSSANHLA